MKDLINKIRVIPLTLFFCFMGTLVCGQNISLKAVGDNEQGFRVGLYNGSKLIVENSEEFSIRMYNLDLSIVANIPHWTGNEWTGNEKCITLKRESYIKEFEVNLSVTVTYRVINSNLVKKTVELFQPNMPNIYYIIKETARPAEKPNRYITFEHDNFPGGFVHEIFSSAGFVTNDNIVVGFLTDAGYKNQFTRNTRRRVLRGGGFVGMRRLADINLFSVADSFEREKNNEYVKQTFGEMYNLDEGTEVELVLDPKYRKEENSDVKAENNIITIIGFPGGRAGLEFIAPFEDQKIYTISFLCKGNTGVAIKLFRIKNGQKTKELEHGIKYIDNFNTVENEWTIFKGSIMVPYIENDSVSMFIGTQSGNECELQIKDLKIVEHQPKAEPYNVLPLGEKAEKTTYIFIEPWKSHQQFMISSQSRLAEGKEFKGTLIEKMLYANLQMHTWITDTKDFTPLNVPNMNYAPDMYNRDTFFSIVSTYNKNLNLLIWEQWGKTQTSKGAIGTIVTPLIGSTEAKDNEATIQWLIWAMLNKRRFNIKLPEDKIKRAVDYVLSEFDADRDGVCTSHFSMSQVDIVDFNPKTDRLGVNQGMLAIALRTIKELGFDISEKYMNKAEEEYRDFYDSERKHLLFDRNYPDVISFTDLEPEFFSLWLFNRSILTDDMVKNHLNQMPVLNQVSNSPYPQYGTTAPICVRLTNDSKKFSYLSPDYQPFEEFGENNYADGKRDGFYYNGGSWLRSEYCAYVVGLKHNWEKAKFLMENRIWAEIYLNPKWPFSKEFIPTKWNSLDQWWVSTRGLCWNVFILMANEVAGLRTPDMDPDYINLDCYK
ncbi:MAG: hypothetical protein JEY94_02285 [Melioribacteraceae bacterium]|nr:hypothetical protein [Melioribacteraceae bacterium]